MPNLNVGELIYDPDFSQDFKVIRRSGNWVNGIFTFEETTMNLQGIIDPETTEDLDISDPTGSRVSGGIRVYTDARLYPTLKTLNGTNNISDEVLWDNNLYTVGQDYRYHDYGYYKYTCQLKDEAGDSNS